MMMIVGYTRHPRQLGHKARAKNTSFSTCWTSDDAAVQSWLWKFLHWRSTGRLSSNNYPVQERNINKHLGE